MLIKPGGRRRFYRPQRRMTVIEEKQLICPICGQLVRVGGPYNGNYTFMPHAPVQTTQVNETCRGTNTTIKASPNP